MFDKVITFYIESFLYRTMSAKARADTTYTKFFISLLERAFKMMKNGVYFTVIALLVAELFKILVYAN